MLRSTRRAERQAIVLLSLLAGVALAAPLLSPYPPNEQLGLLALRSQAPSLAHPFGTDAFSRDVLSRVLHGAQISLAVSLASVLVGLGAGTTYGAMTALASGGWKLLLRRLLDVGLSVPRLLMVLAVGAVTGKLSLVGLVLLLGLTGWFATARQVADALDALREREFSVAARATGVRPLRLIARHLLPHVLPILIINGTFAIAGTIGLEAGLSFLGLGVQPPTASWGTIIGDGAPVMDTAWWITVFPGMATLLAVLACNVAGDALRDRFAPGHVAEP
ncbi:MAG: ABC transporter permease [Gemmatimonadaceae bacterium]|nr:ABC transporter permease [Gemmatimonadaceae bacterium]